MGRDVVHDCPGGAREVAGAKDMIRSCRRGRSRFFDDRGPFAVFTAWAVARELGH